MTKRCPVDPDEVFDDAETLCRAHIRPLIVVVDEPEPVVAAPAEGVPREPWSLEVCWHCGTPSPHPDNRSCLRPDCRSSLTPPALHVRFRDGEVQLDPGGRAELGRQGPHARAFRGFPNVSRRHAVLGVDPDGRAWIEPLPTPNGTFLNGAELPESVGKTLHSGDTVRLALHAEGTVTLYDRTTGGTR
ncbi:FHA domain-containing protein [Saccharothrix sp.]|uniref:FHA domain-containing protein n=1 Tax=Saccharothrix sp. TaxID=1873460 RepID=UPI00281101AE|nr:FHA domain-containing protein [Saccharothrix sp.]